MGAFGEFADDFISRNIPVVPCSGDDGKRPCINNWQKVGISVAKLLAKSGRFNDANIAFLPGKRSGLTVLDIDDPDPKALNAALARFGESPIIIKTGSGKYHAWYKYNGESRMIRPLKNDPYYEKVDILGGGFCVAPPSERPDKGGAKYHWIAGDLDDIDLLPCLENVPATPSISGTVSEGSRTNDLFRELRALAFDCESIDELAFRAEGVNAMKYTPPLSAAEVHNQVKGVWRLKLAGKCIVPGSRNAVLPIADIVALSEYPPALSLLGYLLANHGPDHVFAVSPKGLAGTLPLSHVTIAKARGWLLDRGRLELLKQGRKVRTIGGTVKTEPDLFRLSPG